MAWSRRVEVLAWSRMAPPGSPAGSARPLRGGRALLLAPLLASLVFCASESSHCVDRDAAIFDVTGSCGPDGTVTLSYSGAHQGAACAGYGCYGYLEAPGANAMGLPEQGEADGEMSSAHPIPGDALRAGKFALVGRAPVAGTSPPVLVERRCHAGKTGMSTVLGLACQGEAPEAACTATLTYRGVP